MTTPGSSGSPNTRRETIYATPSDCELVITRTFDAPRKVVWAAFTDPKHVPNWHTGPEGVTMPVCEIDLRAGGGFRYVWRHANGREFEARGTYREVDPPQRLVIVTKSNDQEQNEQTNTTTFAEDGEKAGRTIVTVTLLLGSKEARDQAIPLARFGTESNYARLDTYLTDLTDLARAR